MKLNRKILITSLAAVFLQISSFAQTRTLDYFIGQGLLHNPALKDLSNQVSSTTVDSLLVKALRKPQVGFEGMAYYAPVINGVGFSDVITDVSNLTTVVGVSQQLLNQKTVEAQYSKFGFQNQALRNSARITENSLKKEIALQYLSACSVSNDISFNADLISTLKDESLILKQLVEKGLYQRVDYLTFMIRLEGHQVELNDLQIRYDKEISALHVLCGMSDSTHERLELPSLSLNTPVNPSQSPYFARFVIDSLRIQNQKILIDRDYKPRFKWFSDAGLINNLPQDIYKNFGFSIGLSMSIPIYDGQQRKLNYEKLKIAENTRTVYADYFKNQYDQQLAQLYSELKKTQQLTDQVEIQISESEELIEQERELLNSGNISITDYLAVLNNYISIKQNYNQYRIKVLKIITEINYWNQ